MTRNEHKDSFWGDGNVCGIVAQLCKCTKNHSLKCTLKMGEFYNIYTKKLLNVHMRIHTHTLTPKIPEWHRI